MSCCSRNILSRWNGNCSTEDISPEWSRADSCSCGSGFVSTDSLGSASCVPKRALTAMFASAGSIACLALLFLLWKARKHRLSLKYVKIVRRRMQLGHRLITISRYGCAHLNSKTWKTVPDIDMKAASLTTRKISKLELRRDGALAHTKKSQGTGIHLQQEEHKRAKSRLRREDEQPSTLQHATMLFNHVPVVMLFGCRGPSMRLDPMAATRVAPQQQPAGVRESSLGESEPKKTRASDGLRRFFFSPRGAVHPTVSLTKPWPVCGL